MLHAVLAVDAPLPRHCQTRGDSAPACSLVIGTMHAYMHEVVHTLLMSHIVQYTKSRTKALNVPFYSCMHVAAVSGNMTYLPRHICRTLCDIMSC